MNFVLKLTQVRFLENINPTLVTVGVCIRFKDQCFAS